MGETSNTRGLGVGAALAIGLCGAAHAQDVSGYVDIRGAVADGQSSFLKGDFGKARYGGDSDGDPTARIEVAEAAVVWHPRFSDTLGAIVHLQYQPGADHAVDVVESYLALKAPSDFGVRLSGKAGVFFPQISLEHDEFAWTTYHTITPSAVNTWIGEEIKVLGLEGTYRQKLGPGDLSFTASAFGFDDTAGTVIAFRGWALHDQEAMVFGSFPIPENAPARKALFDPQDDYSKSMMELDGRVGFYGQLRYDTDDGSSVSIFHYDNAGDRMALDGGQWGWETRFTNFGASIEPVPGLRVLSQYVTGETKSGWYMPQVVIDVEFSGFYVLGAWDVGDYELAARYDDFQVDDQSFVQLDNENETGSAVTFAASKQIANHVMGRMELMRIDSTRPQRGDIGLSTRDIQNVFQTSLRFDF